MTWHFFISVQILQKNYIQLVLSMYGNPKSLLHPWKSCKGCDDSSVDSVGSVDNTPSYIANYSRRQSDFAFTRWQFAQFFCVHTFCLQARRSDLKFENPSSNRVHLAAKRWLGQIPTIPLCSDRPSMCPPKTWCQQLESSLHKETLNHKHDMNI